MSSETLRDDEIRALERPGAARESLVPASYAEKAMSSLLRLHEELVEEKEKRIDLYRRLMEREQSLAELRAYVKLLEGELARRGFDPNEYALDPIEAKAPTAEKYRAVAAAVSAPPRAEAAPRASAPAAEPPARSAGRPADVAPAAAPAAGSEAAAGGPTSAASVPGAPTVASPASGSEGEGEASHIPANQLYTAPVIAWTPGPGKIGAIR